MKRGWVLAVLLAGLWQVARAHGETVGNAAAPAWLTQLPIWLAQAALLLAWATYALGAWRHRPTVHRQLLFYGATAVTAVAMFGPFDEWAARSTAAHMVQHMLLMVVAAPLMVLARPLAQWRAALGGRADAVWRAMQRITRRPMLCAVLHAAAIWIWHAPGPYEAAIANNYLHVIEHMSFLLTAWLFWWSVLNPSREGVLHAALAMLFTGMHTGLLGGLLTFARTPLYRAESTALWDQQLAGLIMWIPGGTVYLLAAGWSVWQWLLSEQARQAGSTAVAAVGIQSPKS